MIGVIEQGTHHVTDPPSAPNRVANPRAVAGCRQHRGSRHPPSVALIKLLNNRRQYDEPDDAGDGARPQRDAEERDFAKERCADERLGRVADTDAERDGHWRADEEGSAPRAPRKHAGRQAITEQEE